MKKKQSGFAPLKTAFCLMVAGVLAAGAFALGGCAKADTASDSSSEASATGVVSFEVSDKGASNAGSAGAEGQARGGKADPLAGSEQQTDQNGIIHGKTSSGIAYTLMGAGVVGADASKVSLAAVGDQIGTDNSLPLARDYGSRVGADYDFTPFYQDVTPMIQAADLRYVNQETAMGGGTPTGYPVFNTPDEAVDALHNVGFNLVNFATNHTYDQGEAGILRSHSIFAQYAAEMMVGGSYLSKEDRDTVHMIERNGMRFAFLAYTYGCNFNGTYESFPNDYMLCGFDKTAIEADVKRAQQVADAVIVSMHWGSEYDYEPNDQEYEFAGFLADLDVDLVLGTHAHIMQGTRYITGNSGNTVPVVFGLSDFISGWTLADTHLSGVFTCDFTWANDQDVAADKGGTLPKGGEGGTVGAGGVKMSNLHWYPTIEWSNGGDTWVRYLKDMTPDEVNESTRVIDVPSGDYYGHYTALIDACRMEIPVEL